VSSHQYEFNETQNKNLSGLASKMNFVGFFSVAFGVIGLLITAVVIFAIFRDRLPASWKEKLENVAEKAAEKAQIQESWKTLPGNNHLWGIAAYVGVTSVFFLFLGVWTRSSAAAFRKIVDTRGNDISHLMDALGSLGNMYGLLHTLLVVALLAGLVAVGLAVYQNFIAPH